MIPWTTPTHELTVHGIDLTGYDVYVDYRQGPRSIHVHVTTMSTNVTDTGTDTILTVDLTQRQTGRFSPDQPIEVQVNWVTPSGSRNATVVKRIKNGRQLYERTIEYGD